MLKNRRGQQKPLASDTARGEPYTKGAAGFGHRLAVCEYTSWDQSAPLIEKELSSGQKIALETLLAQLDQKLMSEGENVPYNVALANSTELPPTYQKVEAPPPAYTPSGMPTQDLRF